MSYVFVSQYYISLRLSNLITYFRITISECYMALVLKSSITFRLISVPAFLLHNRYIRHSCSLNPLMDPFRGSYYLGEASNC
jgi:hypothetical protein